METLKLTENDIKKAAQLIQKGDIVAFPTDTVYGLGTDATNEEAVLKIFEAKGRPADRPISVLVSQVDDLDKYAKEVPIEAKKLATKFWPGPLTILLKNAHAFASSVTVGRETVGLRMPDNPIALQFIEACKVPLATPSANSSGRPSPTLAEHVHSDLDGKISAVIDGGETSFGIESTVLDFSNPMEPTILRPGNISKEAIEKVIDRKVYFLEEAPSINSSDITHTKAKHYEPTIPVYIVTSNFEAAIYEMTKREETVGLLASEEVVQKYKEHVKATFALCKDKDVNTANRNLFNGLRTMEKSKASVLLVEAFDEGEMGMVYMNRLQSAANNKFI